MTKISKEGTIGLHYTLEAILEFYADEKNWKMDGWIANERLTMGRPDSPVIRDAGRLARIALGKEEA